MLCKEHSVFYLILLVFLLIGGVLAWIVWQNLADTVQVVLFNWHAQPLPIGLWLIGFFLLGALLLYIVSVLSALKERREMKMLRERVAELEREKKQAQAAAQAGTPSGPLSAPGSMPSGGARPSGPLQSNQSFMPMPGLPGQNPPHK